MIPLRPTFDFLTNLRAISIRLGKTGSLDLGAESWFVVASYAFAKMEDHFGKTHSLLQQTMTLLQGPKDPVLPTLISIPNFNIIPKSYIQRIIDCTRYKELLFTSTVSHSSVPSQVKYRYSEKATKI